jgi:hypothetical protein
MRRTAALANQAFQWTQTCPCHHVALKASITFRKRNRTRGVRSSPLASPDATMALVTSVVDLLDGLGRWFWKWRGGGRRQAEGMTHDEKVMRKKDEAATTKKLAWKQADFVVRASSCIFALSPWPAQTRPGPTWYLIIGDVMNDFHLKPGREKGVNKVVLLFPCIRAQNPICCRPSSVRSFSVARPRKSTSKSIAAKSGAEPPARNAAFCFGR